MYEYTYRHSIQVLYVYLSSDFFLSRNYYSTKLFTHESTHGIPSQTFENDIPQIEMYSFYFNFLRLIFGEKRKKNGMKTFVESQNYDFC